MDRLSDFFTLENGYICFHWMISSSDLLCHFSGEPPVLRFRFFHPPKNAVACSGHFSTQCVDFRIFQIKSPHIPQVRFVEFLAELYGKYLPILSGQWPCFNPCFNGTRSPALQPMTYYLWIVLCFNPCFNGTRSPAPQRAADC